MEIKIIGFLIGLLVFGAGIYYTVKDKNDPESRKIYRIASIIGAVSAVVCLILLFA